MIAKQLITRLVFTSFLIVTLLFSGLGATPVYATGIVVNTALDENIDNADCSLREAIIASSVRAAYNGCAPGSGIDTITFAGNYTITLAGAQLPAIMSNVTIIGNGAANTIIQAHADPNTATYRVFEVGNDPASLTLNSLTLRHGVETTGGGIYVGSFANLNVNNCVISGNTAQIGGGIFIQYGGSMNVASSVLSDNRGENYGGAIVNQSGVVTISDSTLSENTASSGGGIYNDSVWGLTITNSTLSENNATSTGGGIDNTGPVTLTNSTLSGNTAQIGGGMFISRGSTATVTGSILSGNRGENYGGAIVNSGGTVSITNSTLSENSALSGGGGIVNLVPPPTFTSTLTVVDSTLSGNSVDNFLGGGAIYNGQNMNTTVANSTLSGNYAPMGGGIYNDGNLWLGNVTLSGNEAYDYGGGIYSDGYAWIHNSTIVFNTLIEGTPLGAGGIDGDVALYNTLVAGNVRLISSEYRDCHGTIYVEGMNLFGDMTNCTFNPASPGYYSYLVELNELGPLQDNGGPTWTHALLPGSRAIGAGFNAICANWPVSNVDQRGVARPQGYACDVGAFEFEPDSDNVAPIDILLSASTIPENLPASTTVATLTAIDPDMGDTHTYSFCGGAGDASFSLAGNALNTGTVFDFEAQSAFNICIRATDAGGLSFDKAFEILVLDIAENPAPETTFIAMKVRKPRGISTYMFLFDSSILDSTFMCRMDQSPFSPCKNAITYTGLSAGSHTFQVYAISPSGTSDPTPAEYSFTVNQ